MVMTTGQEKEQELFAILLWRIWYARNKLKFDGSVSKVNLEIEWAKSYMLEYFQAQESGKCMLQQKMRRKWSPPNQDCLKINVDAAWNEERSAIGIIVRDSEGQILAAVAEGIGKTLSAEHAEIVAVSKGLQWAPEVGIEACVLEADSSNVVRRLNSAGVDLSVIEHLVDRVKELRSCLQFCNISHVCRTGNVPAHLLAKLAFKFDKKTVWWDMFPPSIVKAALQDVNE